MISMGLVFDSGRLYIFEDGGSLISSIILRNKAILSFKHEVITSFQPLLIGEIHNYAITLLQQQDGRAGQAVNNVPPVSLFKSQQENFTRAFKLENERIGIVFIDWGITETGQRVPEWLPHYTEVFKLALNSFLRGHRNIWLQKQSGDEEEQNRLDKLLSEFYIKMIAIRSISGLVSVIDEVLSTSPLRGEFFITTIGDLPETIPSVIHSIRNYALFETLDGGKLPASRNKFNKRLAPGIIATGDVLFFDLNELSTKYDIPAHMSYYKNNGMKTVAAFPLQREGETMAILWIYLKPDEIPASGHTEFIKKLGTALSKSFWNIIEIEQLTEQLNELKAYKQLLLVENSYLLKEIDEKHNSNEITGASKSIGHLNLLIQQVAPSGSTVLILGETGTGKELTARAIHNASPRNGNIMVKVNCAALPVHLIESELFGHERGSFTGATERHIGKFELAHNGTLFLDEIGEMPLESQVKVLRAIQEKTIERVGGKASINVNVRIIAATNRNLLKEIKEGKFREDLYYRLNVFPITVPPLRERKSDIPVLAKQFVLRFAKLAGKKIESISDGVMEKMMRYDWPGNVRELEHLMERSVLLTKGNNISHVDIRFVSRKLSEFARNEKIKTIDENERDHILSVLKKTNGKVYGSGGAAELLDIHYSTLNSRIKKLGIQKAVTVYQGKSE